MNTVDAIVLIHGLGKTRRGWERQAACRAAGNTGNAGKDPGEDRIAQEREVPGRFNSDLAAFLRS